jgi:methyl-accepting chemotaxis protein
MRGGASISRRLTSAVVATTAASLVAAALLFVAYDTRTGRTALIDRSVMLARVVGIHSAVALAFDDTSAAEETLASLAAADSVLAAAIYDEDGRRFASFAPKSARDFAFPALRSQDQLFQGTQLHVFQPIELKGQVIGTLFLAFDASPLASRIGWYAFIVGVVLVGALGWSSLVASRLHRQISRPLAGLVESSRAISEGDLRVQVNEDAGDEIGRLARTFNGMARGLRDLVEQVRQSTGAVSEVSLALEQRGAMLSREAQRQGGAIAEVTTSVEQVGSAFVEANAHVEELAASSRETSTSILEMDAAIGEIASHMDELTRAIDTTSVSASQVAANIEEVVASVHTLKGATEGTIGSLSELSASVLEVKENAAGSLTLSEDSSGEAAVGRSAVGETVDAMGEIQSAFERLADRVARLAEKSQSIDEIIQVIKGVAQQTGMLSLNAAIIAAQAGEHGRAFSVVADQVSALADRSHRSAREIADLIHAVQDDTAAAVAAVSEGSAKVERGVARSRVADEVLQKILQKTEAQAGRAREIASATQRQGNDLGRVQGAMRTVREIVDQIDGAAQVQQSATAEIGRTIGNIRQLGVAVRHSTEEQRRGSRLIAEAASRVAEMAGQIADAIRAQASSRETIQHAMQVFDGVAQETTRGVEAINSGVATLSARAKQLEDGVGRFKTR